MYNNYYGIESYFALLLLTSHCSCQTIHCNSIQQRKERREKKETAELKLHFVIFESRQQHKYNNKNEKEKNKR